MTLKQLRKALNDWKLLRQGDRSKKSELQKILESWKHENRKSTTLEDGTQSSKVHVVSIRNKPSIKATAIVFSSSEKNQICVAEITGEIYLMTMVNDGPSVTADIIRSVSGWSSLQKQCWILCLFVSWCWGSVPSKLSDRALWTCAVQWQWIIEASLWATICSKSDGKVVLVDRGSNKVKEVDVVSKQMTNLAGSGHTESRDRCDLTASFC